LLIALKFRVSVCSPSQTIVLFENRVRGGALDTGALGRLREAAE
jgi:hypothetical protein